MKLEKISRLSFSQFAWLGEAWFRLVLVRLQLRYKAPAWLAEKVNFVAAAGRGTGQQRLPNEHTACLMHESVRLAARCQPGRVDCLPRSLVLADMLRRHEASAQVVLGAGLGDASIASHAWVEVEGIPVAEPSSIGERFSRLLQP